MDKNLTIGVFLDTAALERGVVTKKRKFLQCFYAGLDALGEDAFQSNTSVYMPCDVAVIFGGVVPTKPFRQLIYNTQMRKNHPTLMIDNSNIRNKQQVRVRYTKIGVNGLYRENVMTSSNDDKRVNQLINDLHIDIKDWRTDGDYILFLLQNPNGWSTNAISSGKWANSCIKEIRKHTDRKIIVRHHPKNPREKKFIDPAIPNVHFRDPLQCPLQDDLDNAWAAASYNSSACLDAVFSGVPLFCGHTSNYAWDVGNSDWSLIESPKTPNRDQWLCDLSYALWNVNELNDGTAWVNIKKRL